jgi:predicted enzyme related to lactoylglutathione lyase
MALIPKFVWFEYVSADEKKAQSFFGELFHWKTKQTPLPSGSYTMVSLGADEIGGYVKPMPGVPYDHAFWMPHLQVENARETSATVTSLGGKILKEPTKLADYGTMVIVSDPQGAVFSLWQPARGEDGGNYRAIEGAWVWNELYTGDPDKATEFYKRLGFEAERMKMHGGPERYDVLSSDGRGRAGVMQMPGVPPHWMPYVQVSNADVIVEKATRTGATIKVPAETIPNVGRLAVLRDPLGAPLGILQPSPM